MEPKLPSPNFGREQMPTGYGQSIEHAPMPANPEVGVERNPEHFEQRSEVAAAQIAAQPILPPPVIPQIPTPAAPQAVSTTDDLPLVANDDDLIEKEWVDKAKRIIVETKDDPYRREQEVGKLQADYLRKRYGRELGASQ
jgi:Txe/YoeB family toxin of Txe-Axe toxin-antitoxin module